MELGNYKLILEHLPGAMVIDMQGKISYISKQCADYIGTNEAYALGRDVREIFPDTKMVDSLKLDKPEIVFYNSFGIGISVEVPLFSDGVKVGLLEYDIVQASETLYELADNYTHYLDQELKYLKHEIHELRSTKYSINNIIGESDAIMRMKDIILMASKTNSTVLIYGETGTGKELVAHSIHSLSKRGRNNFVKVNAASIPENLVESELFGYEGGTFTGAVNKGKKGKFELADKGTLFIDEVNQMPFSIQPKLLRVLQENEIERIGGTSSIPVDVRVIVTTNQDLRTLVKENKFREDLFYRFHVIVIKVPPLRERMDDIPLLVEYFVNNLNRSMGRNIHHIDERIYHVLKKCDWPGNVRQLQNVLECGVSFAKGDHLRLEDLDINMSLQDEPPSENTCAQDLIKTARDDAERKVILESLSKFNYNKKKTAEYLGIPRPLLYQKITRLGIK